MLVCSSWPRCLDLLSVDAPLMVVSVEPPLVVEAVLPFVSVPKFIVEGGGSGGSAPRLVLAGSAAIEIANAFTALMEGPAARQFSMPGY